MNNSIKFQAIVVRLSLLKTSELDSYRPCVSFYNMPTWTCLTALKFWWLSVQLVYAIHSSHAQLCQRSWERSQDGSSVGYSWQQVWQLYHRTYSKCHHLSRPWSQEPAALHWRAGMLPLPDSYLLIYMSTKLDTNMSSSPLSCIGLPIKEQHKDSSKWLNMHRNAD